MKGLLPGRAGDGGPLARAMAAGRTVFAALFLVLWAHGSAAEVARIEVLSRSVLAGGKVFGAAGAYEKITGRLHYAVDPDNPANARIVDVGLAPRERAGRAQNPWFSVHLTWFSTEVDFSSCDVRFGSLADLSACPKNGLLCGVERT